LEEEMLFAHRKNALLKKTAEEPAIEKKGEEPTAEERRQWSPSIAKSNDSSSLDEESLEEALEEVRRHLVH
jgi:hypothetical protein